MLKYYNNLIGLLCAYIAILFNKAVGRIEYMRLKYKHKIFEYAIYLYLIFLFHFRRFTFSTIMIIITVILTYPFLFSNQPDFHVLNDLFSTNQLTSHRKLYI